MKEVKPTYLSYPMNFNKPSCQDEAHKSATVAIPGTLPTIIKPKPMFFKRKKTNLNSPAVQLLYMAVESVELIENGEKLTTYGKIEVILFNANMARLFLHIKNPNLFQSMQQEFDNLLVEHLLSLGLSKKVSDVNKFMNARAIAMDKEIEGMNNHEGWIPARIYDWFFVNPLVLNAKPKIDLLKLMSFQILLSSMISAIKDGVDIIIEHN